MANPTFFPEGHTPRPQDTEHVLLLKILGALIDGMAADTDIQFGSGAPVIAPSAKYAVWFDDDSTSPTGGLFWVWDHVLLKWFTSFSV